MPLVSVSAEFRRGETVSLSGQLSDTVFAAGDEIHAEFDSTDDVFLAGRTIRYLGAVRELRHCFTLGGS